MPFKLSNPFDPFGPFGSGVDTPVIYTLRDEFSDELAAGSVHGTPNTPDANTTRTVVDTGNRLSLTGGYCVVTAGSTYGDPGIWLDLIIARAVGKIITAKIQADNTGNLMFGLDPGRSSTINGNSLWLTANTLHTFNAGTDVKIAPLTTTGADYDLTIVLRAAGSIFFARGVEYPSQTLLYVSALGNTGNQYLGFIGGTGAGKCFYLRHPEDLWFPTPLASDGFGGAFGNTDGLGHAEGIAGGLGAGGSGIAWTQDVGTWSTAAGVCSAELDGGLALATLTAGVDAQIQFTPTVVGGAAGALMRYVDADNHIRVIHDGTNAQLIKRVGGTDTNILTAAVAVGAMQAFADGENVGLWCGNTNVGFQTVADPVLQASSLCGLYTTHASNTLDNFVAWSRR